MRCESIRRYASIAAIAFRDRFASRGDAIMSVAMGGVSVFMAWVLWSAIFSGRTTVGGMSLSMTLTHYVIAAFVGRLDQSEAYVWEFAAEIRGGTFGKYLVRPVDPLSWYLSICIGRSLFTLLPVAAAGLVCVAVIRDSLVLPRASAVLAVISIVVLGLLSLALLNFLAALLAFVFQEITPFHMIKSELVAFLSGSLVPIAMMPRWAQKILAWTPFPASASLPASIWLGISEVSVSQVLVTLIVWNTALFLTCRSCYRILSVRYEEVGA